MEFKIDTKTNYTNIAPVTNHLDAALTEALRQKWNELRQMGSLNFIVDLHNCIEMDKASLPALISLHQDFYSHHSSLVFTGMQDAVLQQLKEHSEELPLNIAPSMAEAIDIVSMEILERELFNEES